MSKNMSKYFAVFGVFLILAMFINIVSFIQCQNTESIESHVVSAFAG